MADLFQEIEDRREDYTVDVVITFLEIYARGQLKDGHDRLCRADLGAL